VSYKNFEQNGRLVIIDVASDLFSDISTSNTEKGAIKMAIAASNPAVYLYKKKEFLPKSDRTLYNMPFLFSADGLPWIEANSYLTHLVQYKNPSQRPTDHARKCASRLLDYKIFCERNNLDWLDFSGKRPSHRPSYKYFKRMIDAGERGPAVINQYTGVIYDFYKFVSKHWHDIDIDRVDTVRDIRILVSSERGSKIINAVKRSQTKATPPSSPVEMGFVRDGGEDLRPLTNSQLSELNGIIQDKTWSIQERLIMQLALFTGARKQSVLTLRMKHLKAFCETPSRADGTYVIHAGPGTGIDTKFNKKQQLYIPRQLAQDILVFARSKALKTRRNIFMDKYKKEFPDLPLPHDEDAYLFLSDQANCYYMSKDDYRYPIVKSPQIGQVTDTLKRKLFKSTSDNFPKDFTYHWLRATYAYQYYQWLLPFVNDGRISLTEQISMVQHRLHHQSRDTTENYLKLFNNVNEKMDAQEMFEQELFGENLIVDGGKYGS